MGIRITPKKDSITVLIFTYNSESEVIECIRAARILSENTVVIDMESTDKTEKIASEHGAKVITFPHVDYVEPAREFGIKQVKTDWVFILDADERMTLELAREVHNAIVRTDNTHYSVPRKNIFARKKWLKHGGWWPDTQIRLIYKPAFVKWPHQIHSSMIIDGERGQLKNPFIHFFHGDLEEMVKKTVLYEDIESDLLFKAKKTATTATFFRKFVGELYRRLLKNVGFLDGEIGIIESIYQAFSKTITYLFLYEKKTRGSL